MEYAYTAIPDDQIPRASRPIFQHLLEIYAGETNKVGSTWREFVLKDLAFKPHPRSSSVEEIMKPGIPTISSSRMPYPPAPDV